MADSCNANLPVLVFAPFGKDASLVERVLRQSSVNVRSSSTIGDFASSICDDAGAAVITEEVLQSKTIGALAQKISSQPPWSDFPLIVLTGSGLSTESSESAVRSRAPLGNVTLLERPLRPVTLISSVRSGNTKSVIICASAPARKKRFAGHTMRSNL